MTSDWKPGGINQAYRDGYDRIFRPALTPQPTDSILSGKPSNQGEPDDHQPKDSTSRGV